MSVQWSMHILIMQRRKEIGSNAKTTTDKDQKALLIEVVPLADSATNRPLRC